MYARVGWQREAGQPVCNGLLHRQQPVGPTKQVGGGAGAQVEACKCVLALEHQQSMHLRHAPVLLGFCVELPHSVMERAQCGVNHRTQPQHSREQQGCQGVVVCMEERPTCCVERCKAREHHRPHHQYTRRTLCVLRVVLCRQHVVLLPHEGSIVQFTDVACHSRCPGCRDGRCYRRCRCRW